MSARSYPRLLVSTFLCLGLCACGETDGSRVQFMSGKPKGKWFADSEEAGTQAAMMMEAPQDAGEPGEHGAIVAHDAHAAQGGGAAPAGGRAATGGAGGMMMPRTPAGGGGAGGSMSNAGAKVTLSFTTVTQHMGKGNASCSVGMDGKSYGPCNIGAVWITTPDGKLVKIVDLWGKSSYVKHLVRYQAERAGMRPDVTASATLKMNEMHTVTWDGTDMMMQPAPLGAYKLTVEVSDSDTMTHPDLMNAVLELSFDTKNRAAVTAADMPYFTNIELKYE